MTFEALAGNQTSKGTAFGPSIKQAVLKKPIFHHILPLYNFIHLSFHCAHGDKGRQRHDWWEHEQISTARVCPRVMTTVFTREERDNIHFFAWWAWTHSTEKRTLLTTDKCSRRETLQFTSFAFCTNCIKFWTLPHQKANNHCPAWAFSFHPSSVLFSKTFLLPSRLGKTKPRLLLRSTFLLEAPGNCFQEEGIC